MSAAIDGPAGPFVLACQLIKSRPNLVYEQKYHKHSGTDNIVLRLNPVVLFLNCGLQLGSFFLATVVTE